jgi:hypothetical protein
MVVALNMIKFVQKGIDDLEWKMNGIYSNEIDDFGWKVMRICSNGKEDFG